MLLVKNGPTFQTAETSRSYGTLHKIASKSSLKNLKIKKEMLSTKNDVSLTYKSQNAYLSGNNLSP